MFSGCSALRGVLQPQLELFGGQRPGEQVTLSVLTAELQQQTTLAFVLDAFGGQQQAEFRGETDDGADDRPVPGIALQVTDEYLVDLQRIKGRCGERFQRRISGAEVVDGQSDAQGLERAQLSFDMPATGPKHRLGDLRAQAKRRQVVLAQDAYD